jgi:hypothetical protein
MFPQNPVERLLGNRVALEAHDRLDAYVAPGGLPCPNVDRPVIGRQGGGAQGRQFIPEVHLGPAHLLDDPGQGTHQAVDLGVIIGSAGIVGKTGGGAGLGGLAGVVAPHGPDKQTGN